MVLDFGAVNRLPDGLPAPIGPLLRLAVDGDADGVFEGLRDEGFVRPGVDLDAPRLLGYLAPILEPARARDRSGSAARGCAARRCASATRARRRTAPGCSSTCRRSTCCIHRVTAGTIGVLCQLEAEAPWRAELEQWLPGFKKTRTK